MKASDRIKRGALEKTFNYFLKDPELLFPVFAERLKKSCHFCLVQPLRMNHLRLTWVVLRKDPGVLVWQQR